MKNLSIIFVLTLAVFTANGISPNASPNACRSDQWGPSGCATEDVVCKYGYICITDRCCFSFVPKCPEGFIEGGPCQVAEGKKRCPNNFDCINDVCCRKNDDGCPKGGQKVTKKECATRSPPYWICQSNNECKPPSLCCKDDCGFPVCTAP